MHLLLKTQLLEFLMLHPVSFGILCLYYPLSQDIFKFPFWFCLLSICRLSVCCLITMYFCVFQFSSCYKICISNISQVRLLLLFQSSHFEKHYFIGWQLSGVAAAAADHLGLNPGSASYLSFGIVPLLLHSKVEIIRIIYIIELLRIPNKRIPVKLIEQILVYSKHPISAFVFTDTLFYSNLGFIRYYLLINITMEMFKLMPFSSIVFLKFFSAFFFDLSLFLVFLSDCITQLKHVQDQCSNQLALIDYFISRTTKHHRTVISHLFKGDYLICHF